MSDAAATMRGVLARVDELREADATTRVEITLADAETFLAAYDESVARDTWRDPLTGRVYGSQRPMSGRAKVGDTGDVFGWPCVVVDELASDTP